MYFIRDIKKIDLDASSHTRVDVIKAALHSIDYNIKEIEEFIEAELTVLAGYKKTVDNLYNVSTDYLEELKETTEDVWDVLGNEGSDVFNDIQDILDGASETADEVEFWIEQMDTCETCYGGNTCEYEGCEYNSSSDEEECQYTADTTVVIEEDDEDGETSVSEELGKEEAKEEVITPEETNTPSPPIEEEAVVTVEETMPEEITATPSDDGTAATEEDTTKTESSTVCQDGGALADSCSINYSSTGDCNRVFSYEFTGEDGTDQTYTTINCPVAYSLSCPLMFRTREVTTAAGDGSYVVTVTTEAEDTQKRENIEVKITGDGLPDSTLIPENTIVNASCNFSGSSEELQEWVDKITQDNGVYKVNLSCLFDEQVSISGCEFTQETDIASLEAVKDALISGAEQDCGNYETGSSSVTEIDDGGDDDDDEDTTSGGVECMYNGCKYAIVIRR